MAANNLAYIYAEEGGNLDIALNLAQTAKQVAPDNPNFTDTLGFVLLKKGLASAAIPEFQAAVNKSPEERHDSTASGTGVRGSGAIHRCEGGCSEGAGD